VSGARAVEQLRLIAAALQLADVRTQVSLSLLTDFEAFTTFRPAEQHGNVLQQLFTEVITWTNALEPVRQT
jgi:NAD(P)H-dependent FMN reductase